MNGISSLLYNGTITLSAVPCIMKLCHVVGLRGTELGPLNSSRMATVVKSAV